jgi:hypothetical protein
VLLCWGHDATPLALGRAARSIVVVDVIVEVGGEFEAAPVDGVGATFDAKLAKLIEVGWLTGAVTGGNGTEELRPVDEVTALLTMVELLL